MKQNIFILKHKNIDVAILSIDLDNGIILNCNILNKEHMPIGFANKKAFNNWWNRRAIPKHQLNQKILLSNNTNLSYMINNLCLSLIDTYWICPIEKDLTWEDINLYEHNFKETDFYFSDLDNVSPFKPSATTQGELQKRWVIDKKGNRYLVKGNYDNSFRQSLNELFATKLHQLQHIPLDMYTIYQIYQLPLSFDKNEGLGCICKNFTTPNLEFIPAYDITFYRKQKNDESIFQQYINSCIELGIDKDLIQNYIDYQILSDFILTNTDRHLLNFGILRDPNTLKAIKPAPIFDTGNSMFYKNKYKEDTIFDIDITSFYKNEIKMLEHVKNPNILDLSKLPTEKDIDNLYNQDPYSIVYLPNIKEGYNKKIEMLNAFQKGYSLNIRSNNFYMNFFNDMKENDISENNEEFDI